VDSAAQLERVLGPGWETYTTRQVEERARELERATTFAWAVANSMRERQAATVRNVSQLTAMNGDSPPS
jgi:hypothetical protein